MSTLTTGDNKFGPARWYVSNTLVDGCTHTTIASAIASASAGDDIFIKPNTYTENLTLKAGVNLVGFTGDGQNSSSPQVFILGKCSYTGSGPVTLSNLFLGTNNDYCLSVTGSSASVVNVINCTFNCTTNTGIQFSSSSALSQINILNCQTVLTSGLFAHTSAGTLSIYGHQASNTGTTASTSTGRLNIYYSIMGHPLSLSSSGACNLLWSSFVNGLAALTTTGTGVLTAQWCNFQSTANSAVSISSSGGATFTDCTFNNGANDAITGTGAVSIVAGNFPGLNSIINGTLTTTTLPISPILTSAVTDTGITAYAVVTGGTSSTAPLQNVSGVGTAGQVLTSAGAGALPTWSGSAPVGAWSDQSGAFNALSGNGYFITAAATPTLPASPNEGDSINFVVDTASTCTITANTGQKIRIGAALSASAGTAANNARGDSIELTYRSTGATWFSVGAPEGTWSVT
jgi:hypothetical protein